MLIYREAHHTDLNVISNLCANSFHEYPFFKTALRNGFRDEKSYAKFMNNMLHVHVKAYMKNHICLVEVKNDRIVSVALLKNPSIPSVSLTDYICSGGIKLLFQVNPVNLNQFIKYMELSYKACEEQKKNAWYLELLAVDQTCQGQNLGSKMIQDCLKPFVSKMKGTELSLITNTELNCKFYEKNGFQNFDTCQIGPKDNPINNWSYYLKI